MTPNLQLLLGKAEDRLAELATASIHALLCDPPAAIKFMGKDWDSDKGGRDRWIAWLASVMEQCLWTCRPGAHGLVWALPRTSHWTAMALEDAGWEVRDIIMHVFGQGFPKSRDISKDIDDAAGVKRKVVGTKLTAGYPDGGTAHYQNRAKSEGSQVATGGAPVITAPATAEAKLWDGWGTALKPAAEHWILVRKPFVGTVAANVLEHGTGALNIDASRVQYQSKADRRDETRGVHVGGAYEHASGPAFKKEVNAVAAAHDAGRWAPHLLLSHSPDCAETCVEGCPIKEMDEQSGITSSGAMKRVVGAYEGDSITAFLRGSSGPHNQRADRGGASRFFPRFRYLPKPASTERHAGCEGFYWRRTKEGFELVDKATWNSLPDGERAHGNIHPTLKSLDLMRWLCRLITPPAGVVLDPFCGSGTTGMAAFAEGFSFIGVEQDHDYMALAQARLEWAASQSVEVDGDYARPKPQPGQTGLFTHASPPK